MEYSPLGHTHRAIDFALEHSLWQFPADKWRLLFSLIFIFFYNYLHHLLLLVIVIPSPVYGRDANSFFIFPICLIFFPFTGSLSPQLAWGYRAFVLRESGRGAATFTRLLLLRFAKRKDCSDRVKQVFFSYLWSFPHHQQTGLAPQRHSLSSFYPPASGKSWVSWGVGFPLSREAPWGIRTHEFCQDEKPSSCSLLPNSGSLRQSLPSPRSPGELPLTQWIQLVWFFLYQTNPTWPKPNMVYLKTNGLKRP